MPEPVQPDSDHLSAANLLTDDAFIDHQLSPTPQSTDYWARWLAHRPHQRADYDHAVALLTAIQLGLTSYAQTSLPEATRERLLTRIRQTNAQHSKPVRSLGWARWAAAALVVLAAGAGLWWQLNTSAQIWPQRTPSTAYTEKQNTTDTAQRIELPDHSQVVLKPDSRLRFSTAFGNGLREVYLSGEARFAVTKNSAKPFLVHAGEVVTRVVGTQFTVRAFGAESRVQVQVQSGQVSVYQYDAPATAGRTRGVMLLPNQQVVFDRTTARFDKSLVDSPAPTAIERIRKAPTFVYNDTPILQVLQELETAYGIPIRYDREALATCQLNATLTNESFAQKLTIVCATVGATYEIIDGQVLINGGNCQAP